MILQINTKSVLDTAYTVGLGESLEEMKKGCTNGQQ